MKGVHVSRAKLDSGNLKILEPLGVRNLRDELVQGLVVRLHPEEATTTKRFDGAELFLGLVALFDREVHHVRDDVLVDCSQVQIVNVVHLLKDTIHD